MEEKRILDILCAHSLRELIETVNSINQSSSPILKDDVVNIIREDDGYIMLYYR